MGAFGLLEEVRGKSSRRFTNETAKGSPSPGGEGRGEGGLVHHLMINLSSKAAVNAPQSRRFARFLARDGRGAFGLRWLQCRFYRNKLLAFSKKLLLIGFTLSSQDSANSSSLAFCALVKCVGTSTVMRTCKSPCP